jgi:hypothetical protein
MLRSAGRVVLWCVVALLLVRGASDVLAGQEPPPRAPESRAVAASWPGDEARAFAADFARAYLSYSPRHPASYARALLPGVDIFTLARRMGTSVKMIDQTYGHLITGADVHERELLDAFDQGAVRSFGHVLDTEETADAA